MRRVLLAWRCSPPACGETWTFTPSLRSSSTTLATLPTSPTSPTPPSTSTPPTTQPQTAGDRTNLPPPRRRRRLHPPRAWSRSATRSSRSSAPTSSTFSPTTSASDTTRPRESSTPTSRSRRSSRVGRDRLVLDAGEMDIEAVSVDGAAADFTLGDDELVIQPSDAASPCSNPSPSTLRTPMSPSGSGLAGRSRHRMVRHADRFVRPQRARRRALVAAEQRPPVRQGDVAVRADGPERGHRGRQR